MLTSVDWTSLDKHNKFINSPEYGPFNEKLGEIMDGAALHHIEMRPFPPNILTKAPCVEVATFYNVEEGFIQNLNAFSQAVDTGKPKGFVGYATGEVVEQITRPRDGSQEGKAAVLLFGWESKEKHMEFRETELFAKHIGLLREKNGGVEMVYLQAIRGSVEFVLLTVVLVSCLFQRRNEALRLGYILTSRIWYCNFQRMK